MRSVQDERKVRILSEKLEYKVIRCSLQLGFSASQPTLRGCPKSTLTMLTAHMRGNAIEWNSTAQELKTR